jgi:hypothetical protein
VTDEVVTAAQLNAHLRDNLEFLYAHHGCRVFKNGDQSVATGDTDLITWAGESYDTDGFHDTGSNTGRITAPWDGYYRALLEVNVDADSSHHNNRFTLSIRQNANGSAGGGTLRENQNFGGHAVLQGGMIHWQGLLDAGDYVEAFFQSHAEARSIVSGAAASNFEIEFLGGP